MQNCLIAACCFIIEIYYANAHFSFADRQTIYADQRLRNTVLRWEA